MSRVKSQSFIVDADAWISAFEHRYPPDVFARLWDLIRDYAIQEVIRTPRQALNETGDGKKGVSAWLRIVQPSVVLRETPRVVTDMNRVVAKFPTLTRGIEDSADPWLVAHALNITGSVVVTEEKPSHGGRPKVPDVCDAFDVEHINVLQMFRRLTVKWVK